MMKLLILNIILFIGLSSTAENPDLKTVRALYFEFDSRKNAASELYDQLSKITNQQAIFKAYQGVALAATASNSMNPMSKWNRFSEGKKLIEQAIKQEPNNAEIRFLRLGVQTAAPSFLGYFGDIDQDATLIIEILEKNAEVFNDKRFTRNVIVFLQDKLPAAHPLQVRIRSLESKLTIGY